MSEEEKKAIKWLENSAIRPETRKKDINAIEILLNLIEKQQKEIEEWQKAYVRENNYWLKFRNKINKIANNDKDCSDNEVLKAVRDLKEKNKVIEIFRKDIPGDTEIVMRKEDFERNYSSEYIRKDKIKAKIEILEKLLNERKNKKAKENLEIKIITLKELLEE